MKTSLKSWGGRVKIIFLALTALSYFAISSAGVATYSGAINGYVPPVAPSFLTSYSTSFATSEDPLSDAGNWARTDNNSTRVITTGGNAIGTQTGTGGYDDSQARVVGFDPVVDLRAEATLFRSGLVSSENHEIELTFKSVETSTTTKKYEVLWDKGGQLLLVKWLGAHNFDQFVLLSTISGSGSSPTPQDGWRIRAEIETVSAGVIQISAWYATDIAPTTWNLMLVGQDNGTIGGTAAYTSGDPGIGFYIPNTSGNPAHYGIKDYSVEVLP